MGVQDDLSLESLEKMAKDCYEKAKKDGSRKVGYTTEQYIVYELDKRFKNILGGK